MDTIIENNQANTFTHVSGKGEVLLITTDEQHDARLIEALRSENIDLVVRRASDALTELPHESHYASIILSNVPANLFPDEYHKSLTRYVRNVGGGLIMTGGDEGFGAGGWIGSPVEQVMPVSFEINAEEDHSAGALVLIMHSCEIPRGNYWGKEVAKRASTPSARRTTSACWPTASRRWGRTGGPAAAGHQQGGGQERHRSNGHR